MNKYCWFGQFSVSNLDLAGTVLTYFPISPALCASSFTPDVAGTYSTTLLSYLASMHQLWRGGITVRLSFAKTNYQNMRIAINYFPGYTAAEIVPGLNFDAVNKIIVDLNESSVIEFSIPYQSNTPWLVSTLFNDANYTDANYTNSLGMLVISVETPLYVQTNSPTHIVCNMWIKGSDDTEFAIADFANYYPYGPVAEEILESRPTTKKQPKDLQKYATTSLCHRTASSNVSSSSSSMSGRRPRVHNHAQVGDENEAPPGANHMEQVNPQPSIDIATGVRQAGNQPSLFCIGDKCDNLRVLCKRSTLLGDPPSNQYTLDPSFFGSYSVGSSNACAVNYISRIFRLFLGGRRYKIFTYSSIITSNPTLTPTYTTASQVFIYFADPFLFGGLVSSEQKSSYITSVSNTLNPVLEVSVPYNRLTPSAIVSDKEFQTDSFRPILLVNSFDHSASPPLVTPPIRHVYTGGADDFSFGYLVGSPVVRTY